MIGSHDLNQSQKPLKLGTKKSNNPKLQKSSTHNEVLLIVDDSKHHLLLNKPTNHHNQLELKEFSSSLVKEKPYMP